MANVTTEYARHRATIEADEVWGRYRADDPEQAMEAAKAYERVVNAFGFEIAGGALERKSEKEKYMSNPTSVSCAFCGARAGSPCKIPSTGKPAPAPHAMRVQAAKKK